MRIGDNTAAEWYVHDIYDENLAWNDWRQTTIERWYPWFPQSLQSEQQYILFGSLCILYWHALFYLLHESN